MNNVSKIIVDQKPDGVLCLGDTNSTLAAALSAVKHDIPVYHIEAGERNFDACGQRVPLYSIPEEMNRILTDDMSSGLFCAS